MTGLIAEEGIKITTLAHGSSIETISPKGGNLEGVYTASFVPRLVLTTYEMVGVVTTSTRLNSRFKRSMTISRWRRPRSLRAAAVRATGARGAGRLGSRGRPMPTPQVPGGQSPAPRAVRPAQAPR